jgi:hypothetical protein
MSSQIQDHQNFTCKKESNASDTLICWDTLIRFCFSSGIPILIFFCLVQNDLILKEYLILILRVFMI